MKEREMSHKYIIVGASGTGKSTMAEALKEFDLKRCTTCTTRPPRPGEKEKGEYYFVDSFDMFSMFEEAEFGGHRYGITKDELSKGDFVILDPQGVAYYQENYPGPLTVIKLERTGIDVDPERRARDAGAGFDEVCADITVHGETVEEMKENLIAGLLAYEARQGREESRSPLAEKLFYNETHGSVVLHYVDSEFDLPVSTSQSHWGFYEYPFGYDGISDYEAADYESLYSAFYALNKSGREGTLDFYVQDKEDNPLFFCRLRPENGRITGELYLYYLKLEPLRFETKSPYEAVALATGGFRAAESDCLGIENFRDSERHVVTAFRNVISDGRFEIQPDRKITARHVSLDSKIRNAAAASRIQTEKLYPFKTTDLDYDGR